MVTRNVLSFSLAVREPEAHLPGLVPALGLPNLADLPLERVSIMDTEKDLTQSVQHGRARRRVGSEPRVGLSRPPLYLVPPVQASGQAAIWHGDPDSESPQGTVLRDWPTARAFAPLIAAALHVGDMGLVRQLRADQRYCAEMRRKIRRAQADGRQDDVVLRGDESRSGERTPQL
jgi:hypothetical protein